MSVTELSVVQLAIGAAILAVLYGAFMSKWIINLPAGNKKMKEFCFDNKIKVNKTEKIANYSIVVSNQNNEEIASFNGKVHRTKQQWFTEY